MYHLPLLPLGIRAHNSSSGTPSPLASRSMSWRVTYLRSPFSRPMISESVTPKFAASLEGVKPLAKRNFLTFCASGVILIPSFRRIQGRLIERRLRSHLARDRDVALIVPSPGDQSPQFVFRHLQTRGKSRDVLRADILAAARFEGAGERLANPGLLGQLLLSQAHGYAEFLDFLSERCHAAPPFQRLLERIDRDWRCCHSSMLRMIAWGALQPGRRRRRAVSPTLVGAGGGAHYHAQAAVGPSGRASLDSEIAARTPFWSRRTICTPVTARWPRGTLRPSFAKVEMLRTRCARPCEIHPRLLLEQVSKACEPSHQRKGVIQDVRNNNI